MRVIELLQTGSRFHTTGNRFRHVSMGRSKASVADVQSLSWTLAFPLERRRVAAEVDTRPRFVKSPLQLHFRNTLLSDACFRDRSANFGGVVVSQIPDLVRSTMSSQ